jgi:uncharacterized membrane protein
MLSKLWPFKKSDYKISKWLLVIFSFFALVASFVLSVEKIHLLKDPNATLSCSFNLILNCASVMKTPEAALFWGVPNSFWGIVGFTAALTLSIVILSGVKLSRRLLVVMQAGFVLGWIFALGLFFTSVYKIQVLCPWCLVVTTSMTILFFALLHYNLRQNVFRLSKKTNHLIQNLLDKDYDKVTVVALLVLFTVLVFIKFGDSLF